MRLALPPFPFVLGALLLGATPVLAQPTLEERCTLDSLTIDQARARIEWARDCGLLTNVRDITSKRFVANQEDIDAAVADEQEPPLAMYDYHENTASSQNTFSGPGYAQNVNDAFLGSMYQAVGAIKQSTDTKGGINYYRWTKLDSRRKERPAYPTFGTSPAIASSLQLFVRKTPAGTAPDCKLYKSADAYGNGTGEVATNYYVNGYCVASCYTPEQTLLFSDGEQAILPALQARRDDIVTLSSQSTLEQPQLQVSQVYSYIAELRDAQHVIHDIRTASGGQLRVTPTHGVLVADGRMVEASFLRPGHELLKPDGTRDAIVSVTTSNHFGKVYNVRPAASSLLQHVVVAQGFLVGSSQYQNDFVNYINRIVLHSHVPEDLIPE